MSQQTTQQTTQQSTYKFKTRKSIELFGQTFEEFATTFPPESTITAVLHAWNTLKSKFESGEVTQRRSSSNKHKKSDSDAPTKKSDYQLFGVWLKMQNSDYKLMKINDFSKLQSSLWKNSAELDEWKSLSTDERQKVIDIANQPKPSTKSKKTKSIADQKQPQPSDEQKQPQPSDSNAVKPKKSKKSDSDKPSSTTKKSKKLPQPKQNNDEHDELSDSDFQ
jgi:predicted Fe-S protein YdhL (DUF1289 family)